MQKHFFSLLLAILLFTNTLFSEGFIENKGQWDGEFKFKKEHKLGAIFLEVNAITFNLRDWTPIAEGHHSKNGLDPKTKIHYHAFKLMFEGANENVNIVASDFDRHYVNYILGNDQSKWKSNIFPAKKIVYENLYDGIDLHIIDLGESIKYEFHVQPFADPDQIKIKTQGLDGLTLQKSGELILKNSVADIVELKPKIFQNLRGKQVDIEGGFIVEDNTIRYSLSDYDSASILVIDPELIFSTFSGSGSDNWGFTATPDQNGFLISGSIAFGTNYPTTAGAYDLSFNQGEVDACITKYDTTGTFLIYSTYLGGSSTELPQSLITDENNNTYILGSTGSSNFPMLSNSFDPSFNGGNYVDFNGLTFGDGTDLFLVALNSSGTSLAASTFLGGTGNDGVNISNALAYNYADQSRGEVNIDADGFIYVASTSLSVNFPVSTNAYQTLNSGQQDGVVLKLPSSLRSIVFSTYIGGNEDDAAYAVDVAADGTVYIGGGTESFNFPVTNGAFDNSFGGSVDGFISRLNPTGQGLIASTFIGTNSYDQIYLLQLSEEDNPHYFGQTEHSGSQLIMNAAYNNVGGGQIVGNINSDLASPVWMTQFGPDPGQPNISPTAFLVDVCNSVYLAGWGGNLGGTGSNIDGLITTADAFKQNPDNAGDFYIAVMSSDGNSLVYGSYYGGNQNGVQSGEHVDGGTSRFDRSGKVYQSVCAGCGGSDNFPIEPDPGAWSPNNGSNNCNNAVFKIDFDLPLILADFNIPKFGCAPFTLAIPNRSTTQTASSFFWDFGNGTTSINTNPVITYTESGEYTITLVVNDPTSCNLTDTLQKVITIQADNSYSIPTIDTCIGATVLLGPSIDTFQLGVGIPFWIPSNLVSDPTALNPTATLTQDQTFSLIIDYGGCQLVINQSVDVDEYPITTSGDTIICSDFIPFEVIGTAFGAADQYEWSLSPDFDEIIDNDSILQVNSLEKSLTYFYLRTTKPNGCQMMDTVLVTISDFDIKLTADTNVCKNEVFRIEAKSENPLNTFDYFWTRELLSENPNAELLTDTNANFLELKLETDSTFYLFARSNRVTGCFASDSVRISVSELDKSLVSASASSDSFLITTQIELTGTPGDPFNHLWVGLYIDDPGASSTLARPKGDATYVYVVSDPEIPECQFRDTVTVYAYDINCDEPDIFIPDAFTPNGDEQNDVFYVRGPNVLEVEMLIYNRWGNLVFESNDKDLGWDGTVNGEPERQGVYNYYINVKCINQRSFIKKGNLSLLEP